MKRSFGCKDNVKRSELNYLSVIFASEVDFIPAEAKGRDADLGEGEALRGEDTRGQGHQGHQAEQGGHGDTRPGQSQLRAS